MSTKNAAITLLSTPSGLPVPGKDFEYRETDTIDVDKTPLDGGILVKAVHLAIDPFMAARMRMGESAMGKPIVGSGVGLVVRSEHKDYKAGEHVWCWSYPFEKYSIISPKAATAMQLKVVKEDADVPLSAYCGPLGLAGFTAWMGHKALIQPNIKAGETIYVNAASGVVGIMICQLAKLDGLKVIASAGSAEKTSYLLNEVGVDVAFNYKTEDTGAVLKSNGGVDVFFDNVGGKSLETTLNHMKTWGRVILCGFASEWDPSIPPHPLTNSKTIVINNLTVTGFLAHMLALRHGDFDFTNSASQLIKDGKLKVKEHISNDMSEIPQLLVDTIKGRLFGKAVVAV